MTAANAHDSMMGLVAMIPRRLRAVLFEVCFLWSRIYFFTVNCLFALYHGIFTKRISVPPPSDDLLQISATQAARMIRQKEISSLELIEAYIRRIEEVNPIINAVVERNFAEARIKAREVDREIDGAEEAALAEMERSRPLLGVPFTIKDCMEVAGKKCTYGVYLRKDTRAVKNAVVVDRMLGSGAILLCITNVPEVCMWWESVNTIYGRTGNPYDNRRIAGGSSGGEAALIAAAGSLIGVGSDIGGSIRMPAFFNGVFGLKPSPGVIPLNGHLPPVSGYRKEMLKIGPICRYASDLGLVYKVMAGESGPDLRIDEPIPMNRLRVFYMEGLRSPLIESASDEMTGALSRAVRFLEMKYDLAAVRVDFPLAHRACEFFMTSMKTDDPKMAEILANFNGSVNCWWEMLRCIVGASIHTFPALLTAALDDIEPFGEEEKKKVLYKRDRLIREMKDLLGDDGILLFPSFCAPAPYHNQPLLTPLNFGYTGLFNAVAFPVAQCPMGLSPANGMPLGVQVIGSPRSERNLIAIAKDLEEGFGGWHVPA